MYMSYIYFFSDDQLKPRFFNTADDNNEIMSLYFVIILSSCYNPS
jgi:hypothetical protein